MSAGYYKKLGHEDTRKYKMPFGNFRDKSIAVVPNWYLSWLSNEDWFEKKYPLLQEAINAELKWRSEFEIVIK